MFVIPPLVGLGETIEGCRAFTKQNPESSGGFSFRRLKVSYNLLYDGVDIMA